MGQSEKSSAKYLKLKQEHTRAFAELNVAQNKISDLKGLLQVSSLINSSIDSHELLETIVSQARSVLQAEGAALLIYHPINKSLMYEAIVTENKVMEDPGLKMASRESLPGWVAEHQAPVYVADIDNDSRFENLPHQDLGLEVRSILVVPMLFQGKLLGVLEAVNPSLKRFIVDEALELFGFFANQAASAISNAKLFGDFKDLFVNTVRSLSHALEAKDEYTSGHAHRVAAFSIGLAKEMGMSLKDIENVELSALLHDIGKIGVPEGILTKPAKVTEAEFEEIKKHPVHGFKILEPLEHLEEVLPGIMHHHERWDGKGYPDGLKGGDIPLAARIVCVADAFDAMTSTRPYRKALPDDEALKRLKESSGTQFDPDVVDACFRAYEKGLLVTTNKDDENAA